MKKPNKNEFSRFEADIKIKSHQQLAGMNTKNQGLAVEELIDNHIKTDVFQAWFAKYIAVPETKLIDCHIDITKHLEFQKMKDRYGLKATKSMVLNALIEFDAVANLERALAAWSSFSDVPTNIDDEIEIDFLHFSKGESRFDVWRWFEDTFNVSVAVDLMGSEN
jgi:hypothetical protein